MQHPTKNSNGGAFAPFMGTAPLPVVPEDVDAASPGANDTPLDFSALAALLTQCGHDANVIPHSYAPLFTPATLSAPATPQLISGDVINLINPSFNLFPWGSVPSSTATTTLALPTPSTVASPPPRWAPSPPVSRRAFQPTASSPLATVTLPTPTIVGTPPGSRPSSPYSPGIPTLFYPNALQLDLGVGTGFLGCPLYPEVAEYPSPVENTFPPAGHEATVGSPAPTLHDSPAMDASEAIGEFARLTKEYHNLRKPLEKNLPCPYDCGLHFARMHDLRRHTHIHTGATPFECHCCGKGFRRSDARQRHWKHNPDCRKEHARVEDGLPKAEKEKAKRSRARRAGLFDPIVEKRVKIESPTPTPAPLPYFMTIPTISVKTEEPARDIKPLKSVSTATIFQDFINSEEWF